MKYQIRNRNGDIGEHLVAFRVMKLLGWPCRLLSIDLGIDAEVEVCNAQSESTGDIIRLQIKSTDSHNGGDRLTIYTDERHVNYWKNYCAPVVFVGVDLKTETVYWRQITSLGNYDTDGQSKKIGFCTKHDLLDAETAEKWRGLITPENFADINPYFEQLNEALEKTKGDPCDAISGNEHLDIIAAARVTERKIREIISYHPWKISGVELDELNRISTELNHRTTYANAAITGSFS